MIKKGMVNRLCLFLLKGGEDSEADEQDLAAYGIELSEWKL
jgi:hypothetical protein